MSTAEYRRVYRERREHEAAERATKKSRRTAALLPRHHLHQQCRRGLSPAHVRARGRVRSRRTRYGIRGGMKVLWQGRQDTEGMISDRTRMLRCGTYHSCRFRGRT